MAVNVKRSGPLVELTIRPSARALTVARVDTARHETVDVLTRRETLRLIRLLLEALELSETSSVPPGMADEIRAERARANTLK